jgi:predicted protein tyrosine phosphatase
MSMTTISISCASCFSQGTGSYIEEEMYNGVAVFAPTSQLTKVALELLNAPKVRWEVERNANRFMTADHLSTTVPLFSHSHTGIARSSSLALLAKALQTAAGGCDLLRDLNF